ncbi:MAG: glycosyltransferase [Chitinispirillaceae bacterium]|nr:glycosyltransferase [Chitinispirillaceae bacterium]
MAKIVFFCHCKRLILDTVEFYKQDIDALRELGHQVLICTKYREIPFNFDAIFIWWWTYALWPVLLSRILKKPSIITGTFNFRFPKEFEGRDYFRRPFWQRILIKKAACLCTLNLFVNEHEFENCSKHFNISNIRFYPHIIHSDYLKGHSEQRINALFNLCWSEKSNLIRKGIPELLYAVRLLKDEGFEVNLKLAGLKGNGVDYLIKTIKQLNISQEVKYLGTISRDDKIKLLRSCETYVQPSHYEGFGVAVAEAMGCGACIITCDVGAVRAVVGDSGLYVSPGSPEELANAIKHVLSDNKLRHDLQKNSYQRALNCFTIDNKFEKLKNYLADVGVS